jgi:hypothetical protein
VTVDAGSHLLFTARGRQYSVRESEAARWRSTVIPQTKDNIKLHAGRKAIPLWGRVFGAMPGS